MRRLQPLKLIRSWLPVVACMLAIFYVSSVPGKNIPSLFKFQDVAFHFLIYCILGLFFSRALKNTYKGISYEKIFIFTVVFGVLYGISDEFHQSFTPLRFVSGFDVFIDGIGSCAGGVLIKGRQILKWLR
jgi:VanZ family protein